MTKKEFFNYCARFKDYADALLIREKLTRLSRRVVLPRRSAKSAEELVDKTFLRLRRALPADPKIDAIIHEALPIASRDVAGFFGGELLCKIGETIPEELLHD